MSDFQTIVGMLLSDAAFCERLLADPAGTLRAHGVEPTGEMLAALKDLDPAAVQRLAAAFNKEQAAS